MRSCAYCGKELAPGEKCNCAESCARRKAAEGAKVSKENTTEHTTRNSTYKKEKHKTYSYNDPNRTQYQTGYMHKDSKFKKAFAKAKVKRQSRRSYAKKNIFKTFYLDFIEVLRSPVEAVQNPHERSMGKMISIWAVQGAALWLCMYFIMTNVPHGPFALLGNLLAFRGIDGYKAIAYMLMAVASGAVGGIVMFFLYTGVFFAINRFIFRDRMTPYKNICERLAITAVPMALISIIGALFSMFSSTTLIILLICGAISFVIMTYEALKVQWVQYPNGKSVYGMMIGFFILLTVICYIIRLA